MSAADVTPEWIEKQRGYAKSGLRLNPAPMLDLLDSWDALRSEVVALRAQLAERRFVVPELRDFDLPHKGKGTPGYEAAFVDYGFRRGYQWLAAKLGHEPSVKAEANQKRRDDYLEWDRENHINGVGI